MAQHIDTAPVWEAYKDIGECPLCTLESHCEQNYVDGCLGGAVMEKSSRIETNEKGFCSDHLKMMYDARNRLGISLMAHTHLLTIVKKMRENAQALQREASGGSALFKRKSDVGPAVSDARALSCGCVVCERMRLAIDRYEETILYMWKHESAFRETFSASKGFCLKHYGEMAECAMRDLSGKDRREFLQSLSEIELKSLDVLEKDIEWFTLKFDYRNQDKPWGNSRDATKRTLNKLRGRVVPESD